MFLYSVLSFLVGITVALFANRVFKSYGTINNHSVFFTLFKAEAMKWLCVIGGTILAFQFYFIQKTYFLSGFILCVLVEPYLKMKFLLHSSRPKKQN